MKILMVNKFFYLKGGSEKFMFSLAGAFKNLGHEVIFFSMKDEKNYPCDQEEYFVSNASTDGSLKSKLNMIMHLTYSKEAYRKMKLLLEKENPEIVILNLVHKQITCSIIDAIKDYNPSIKIIWTMHDLITICPSYTMLDGKGNICEKCLDGNFKQCVKNKCIKGSTLMSLLSYHETKKIRKKGWYNKVDLFICPSKFYENKLKNANFTTSKIICLRNPLPIDTKYEINFNDEKYILYFGRLSKEKGVKTLTNVMKDIDYKLIILGTGPIEQDLRKYVKTNNIINVEFKGFVQGEELTNYIRKSRCVVLPSEWYENGPYSAMEAMALGKPLIVSNYGGLPELVENEINGYIFNDKEELKEKIERIISLDYESYKKLCVCSQNKARSMFDAQDYISGIIKELN